VGIAAAADGYDDKLAFLEQPTELLWRELSLHKAGTERARPKEHLIVSIQAGLFVVFYGQKYNVRLGGNW
jgi:hypothetical protein